MSNNNQYQAEGVEITSAQKASLDDLVLPHGEHITIHMVHLNHLDLTWYWQLSDTIEMCLETIRWHTELLERHPDARYSHTQVLILKIVEQIDPELFRRFAGLVREGRVEIDSGQVVEPDHNIPDGESLARQFLYGQSYLRSRFGLTAQTIVNSDSFGHNRNLPQIARQAGVRHMIHKRPRQRYVDLPETPYLWQGIDGTGITALRFINKGAGLPSLSQYYDLPEGVSNLQEKVNRNLSAGIHHLFGSHCNSDAGGVTPYAEPCSGTGYDLQYGTPTQFFEAVLAEGRELPVVERPLNYVYQGCYTSHIEEKEHCRRAERELREVEFLWTLASLAGSGYPRRDIAALWWRACYLQFHDIVTGTGSPESHRDSSAHYHELFLGTNILRRKAQLLLDRQCPKSDAPRTYTVGNPRARTSSGIVEVDVELPIVRGVAGSEENPDTGLLKDDAGNLTPYQIVDRRVRQRFVRGTMLFSASEVPAMGLKTYRYCENSVPETSGVHADGSVIENEHLRVEVGGPGIVRSIRTKRDGREWLREPVKIELWPETDYPGDYSSDMKAWMLGITDNRESAEATQKPEATESGPVRATIRTEHRWGQSTFRTDVSLCTGQEWVDLRIEIDWHEKEVLARLYVEPELTGCLSRAYGIAFGAESATGEELEVPVVGWADVSGDGGGIALLNRDRPGHTFRDNALRVSLVRCATGDYDPCTDSGTICATLRLLPHIGTWSDAGVPLRSDEFSHPFTAWQSDPGGSESQNQVPFQIDGDGILMACCKAAESGDSYVVRLYESLGKAAEAQMRLGPALSRCRVFESNITEEQLAPLEADGGSVKLSFRPFEVKTLLLNADQPIRDVEPEFDGTFFSP